MNARRRVGRRWIVPSLLAALVPGLAVRAAANPLAVSTRVGVSEEYNDNVFFQPQKEDDYITTLTVGLNLAYRTESTTTTLSTGLAGSYFARRTVTSLDLGRGQRLQFATNYQYSSRLSFTISDSLARLNSSARTLDFINSQGGLTTTDTAAQDPAQVNPNDVNILLPRGSAFTNSFGLGANYLFTPLWTGGLSYTNGVSSFTDPNSTNVTNRVGLQLAYQWSSRLSLNGGYTYSRFDADNAPDSNGHTATVGTAYAFSPLWTAFAAVGASLNDNIGSGSGSGSTSATFNVGLDRVFEHSSLALGARQGLTPSAGVAGTSVTLTGYGNYSFDLGDHLSGILVTSYTNYDTSSGNFSAYQLYGGLFYPVWRTVTAGLVYAYRRTDSSQAIGNTLQSGVVDGNIVRLQIGTTFQLWQLDV